MSGRSISSSPLKYFWQFLNRILLAFFLPGLFMQHLAEFACAKCFFASSSLIQGSNRLNIYHASSCVLYQCLCFGSANTSLSISSCCRNASGSLFPSFLSPSPESSDKNSRRGKLQLLFSYPMLTNADFGPVNSLESPLHCSLWGQVNEVERIPLSL